MDDHATGNGHIVVWSPYTVTIIDTTAPPVPAVAGWWAGVDTLVVAWFRDDATRDLAGYLVEYTVPGWDLVSPIPHVRRVLPSKRSLSPFVERVRLGGLFLSAGQPVGTGVCVRSYDASGNVSDCAPTPITMPELPQPRLGPPEDLALGSDGFGIMVDWVPPASRDLAGSLLDYAPVGCLVERPNRTADEGSSPLAHGPRETSARLTGLTPGQVYEIGLRGYRAGGEVGARLAARIMNIDPADADADGIPDQWARLYELQPETADLDGDGLPDGDEFRAASNPRRADSDGDGAYDGQEAEAGSDPCDPGDRPPREAPRLALVGDAALHYTSATNLGPAEPQLISILNAGGGTLQWEAHASTDWIRVSPARGSGIATLSIEANPAGLGPGLHAGSLVILNSGGGLRLASGREISAEAVTISVTLLVLPPKERQSYLPVVRRIW